MYDASGLSEGYDAFIHSSGTWFTAIALYAASSSLLMTSRPWIARLMFLSESFMTAVRRLKRDISCTSTVFMLSSYRTGYLGRSACGKDEHV